MKKDNASVLHQISARLKTSSAVVPALLAALIAMPIGASGLALGGADLRAVFTIVLLSPLFVVLGQITFFTFFDRDRLHNEEHIERRMKIEQSQTVIGDNNSQKEILIEGQSAVESNRLEDGR